MAAATATEKELKAANRELDKQLKAANRKLDTQAKKVATLEGKLKAAAAASTSGDLFTVATAASTKGYELRPGQIAEAGAPILKTHGHLFKPLEVTYTA